MILMRVTLRALLLMIPIVANASQIGLVLSGGGAKGAYEVGVWSVLHEAGLAKEVVAISGTSIGAVNAALFASWPDPKGAERLWLENLAKVFVPNEKILQLASEKKFAEFRDAKLREYADVAGIPAEKLPADSCAAIILEAEDEFRRKGILKDIATALKTYEGACVGKASDGLCDGVALRTVLESNLPTNWPGATPRVYATALTSDEWKPYTFCLNEGTPEERILRLLASTAIPVVFPPVKIDGKSFVDGGWETKGGNNVPINPILANHPEVKTIVVVYLYDTPQRDRVRRAAEQKAVKVLEVIPSEDIGGFLKMFDTSPDTAKRLIELGRKDAQAVLKAAGLGKQR